MPRPKNFADRGVSSLSTSDADFEALFAHQGTARTTQDLAVERIRPNPFQARRSFDGIAELADAIKVQGFVTRLRVRPTPSADGTYQLVFGERRLRAAIEAGLANVPCEIADHTDEEMIEIGLAENIQRQDLNPLEEAHAFHALIEGRRYTHAQLAERLGKDRSYVEDRLILLRAPEDVQTLVAQRPDTLRAAREIARVAAADERGILIAGVAAGNLSQHQVRSLVREHIARAASGNDQNARAPEATAQGDSTEIAHLQPASVSAATVTAPQTGFERALERDEAALRVMCSRWRQAIPKLTREERRQLSTLIRRRLAELERLQEALQP